jgi:hypothetical protein
MRVCVCVCVCVRACMGGGLFNLVVGVPGHRSNVPGAIPSATRFSELVFPEWGPHSLIKIPKELLE